MVVEVEECVVIVVVVFVVVVVVVGFDEDVSSVFVSISWPSSVMSSVIFATFIEPRGN